ncbi:MAG: thioesterase II family protein [Ktedonobacteraceae bacterium]
MHSQANHTPWIICPRPQPQAQLRLFCFPYAGGGASLYRTWHQTLPPTIEICPVQFPGRENRLTEQAFTQVEPLIQDLYNAISPYLDKPFAFFGHSMGALVSFELTRYLRQKAGLSPQHLCVSAHRAPHLPDRHTPIYQLPYPEFREELRHLNGTPEGVLQNEELMQLLLPTLRADFTLCETYTYDPQEPLACPIAVFGGTEDDKITSAELQAWHDQTQNAFVLHMLPGDHFFIHSTRELLLRTLSKILGRYTPD